MGINYFTTIERKLYLRPAAALGVRTFHSIDKTPLFGTSIELKNETTGQVFPYQNDDYSHTAFFSLDFVNDYLVSASKAAFSGSKAKISTDRLNQSDTIYQDLYLSPFSGLPLVLYFDNAKPAFTLPSDTTTLLTYEETYRAYLERKPAIIAGYTAGMPEDAKALAEKEILDFFDNEVQANYRRLESWYGLLKSYLRAGRFIEILVAGYASPLASAEYNKRLTGRRIHSVVNLFGAYDKGALLPFIQSGQLVIKKDPRGEDEEHGNVSDRDDDRRNSEFSPSASRLRRVTITEIRAQSTGVSSKK
jgi:hypothetical protein